MKPLMSPYEIRLFKKALIQQSKNGKTVRVLEWGSGGSTVHYTEFMRKYNIPYTWNSIEYNKGWFEKVRDKVKDDPNTTITLFDVGNNNLRQRYIDMDEYVNYPSTLGQEFDIIFVDGRKRRRCLIEASKLISKDGVVFLHDAQRKYYQCAFREYSNNTFASVNLWRGKMNKINFVQRFINNSRRLLYKVIYKFIVRPYNTLRGHTLLKLRLTRECLAYGDGTSSKLKMALIIGLLALKKKGVPVRLSTSVCLNNRKEKVRLSTSQYKDAISFSQDIASRARV